MVKKHLEWLIEINQAQNLHRLGNIDLMPNKKAKDKKHLKKILNKWLNRYGRTKKQRENYKKKHGEDSIPPMPTF